MGHALPSLPNLDLDLARTFVAICETGNFSRAAERVFRTPSAVSLQVKKLEELIGRPLFTREPREVVPTGDGEMLLGFARRLLKLNDEAMAQLLMPPIQGTVRFGVPNDAGILAIPALLKRFASTHPNVAVDVRLDYSGELGRRFEAGDLDLALFATDDPPAGLAEEIYRERLVWVGLRHGEAMAREPAPLALADPGCWWRAAALKALDRAGVDYRIAYSSETCQGQLAAVEADLAVAPLPVSVLSRDIVELTDETRFPTLGSFRVFSVVRPGAGPVVDAFATHVLESFRELSGRGMRIFA